MMSNNELAKTAVAQAEWNLRNYAKGRYIANPVAPAMQHDPRFVNKVAVARALYWTERAGGNVALVRLQLATCYRRALAARREELAAAA